MATSAKSLTGLNQRERVILAPLALGLVIITGLLVQSYNIFGFPLYLGDEGIYMARAYAVAKMGWLTPYTYWYDHAPAGWLLVAAWSALSGGFETFGMSINSGRVLMLVIYLATLALLFHIILRLTANIFAATTAGLIYALSPLTVIYGRMVLLDNMMIFWTVLATTLLLHHNGKLWTVFYSGLCFGIAALTKENAILLLPAFLYGLWKLVEKNHARFARTVWLFTALATISLYPLYAALRKELVKLDLSSPFAGEEGSISLIGSVLWQINRSGGAPWDPTSDFYRTLTTDWLTLDPWLLGLGIVATVWMLVRGDHSKRFVALLSILAIVSIAHGNPVFKFYVVSVLPFLALNVGMAVADLAELMQARAVAAIAVIAVVAIGWQNLSQQQDIFTLDLTIIQRQALSWVQKHVPPGAQIVTDDDLWVDLRNQTPKHPGFPGAHSHWQVADDPAVYRDLFHEDWRLIDYMILTPELDEIFKENPGKLTYEAYSHSTPVTNFSVGNANVEIRKVNHPGIAVQEMLDQSYRSFVSRYITNGQVRPEQGYTNAHNQAIALLMAVWMDDQETFDELWRWTAMHLQSEEGLLYYTNEPGVRLHSATEAETDAALALVLAEKRWRDASYGRHARRIIEAIWENSVVTIGGKPYLAAGDWAVTNGQIIIAPSTFAPYAYHLFAEIDPDHNWWYLLDTQYALLNDIIEVPLEEENSVGLPPTYVGLNRKTGQFVPNPSGAPIRGNSFNEQAAQVYWRVGLEAQWHDDERADQFLKAAPYLAEQWKAHGKLGAIYTRSGVLRTPDESLVLYSAVLPKFLVEDEKIAHEVYAAKLVPAFSRHYSEGQWGDGLDVNQEQWAWLTTGLYAKALRYQWEPEMSSANR